MKKPTLRVIYHPAPTPDLHNGGTLTPDPINLGSNLEFALGWIRRRIGLGRPSKGLRERPPFLPPER